MPLIVVATALKSAAGRYAVASAVRVRVLTNGIASGTNFSWATTGGEITEADFAAVGEGIGEGDGAAALAGGVDGEEKAAGGEDEGSGVTGLIAATCGCEAGVISSLVK